MMILNIDRALISIHASAKEATRREDKRLQNQNFNPRLREGGDHVCHRGLFCNDNFNPRLREGGDLLFNLTQVIPKISIHASAKEATYGFIFFNSSKAISIHASAKEATLLHILLYLQFYFNPRLREGGDPKSLIT